MDGWTDGCVDEGKVGWTTELMEVRTGGFVDS